MREPLVLAHLRSLSRQTICLWVCVSPWLFSECLAAVDASPFWHGLALQAWASLCSLWDLLQERNCCHTAWRSCYHNENTIYILDTLVSLRLHICGKTHRRRDPPAWQHLGAPGKAPGPDQGALGDTRAIRRIDGKSRSISLPDGRRPGALARQHCRSHTTAWARWAGWSLAFWPDRSDREERPLISFMSRWIPNWGSTLTRRCTWSGITSSSSISAWCSRHTSEMICFKRASIVGPTSTFLRYFGHQTTW